MPCNCWQRAQQTFPACARNVIDLTRMQVPDVMAACKRFEECGVAFQKKPDDGSMKGIAFIKDPDGYWIEVLNAQDARSFFPQ